MFDIFFEKSTEKNQNKRVLLEPHVRCRLGFSTLCHGCSVKDFKIFKKNSKIFRKDFDFEEIYLKSFETFRQLFNNP